MLYTPPQSRVLRLVREAEETWGADLDVKCERDKVRGYVFRVKKAHDKVVRKIPGCVPVCACHVEWIHCGASRAREFCVVLAFPAVGCLLITRPVSAHFCVHECVCVCVCALGSVAVVGVLKDGVHFTTEGPGGLKILGRQLKEAESAYEEKQVCVCTCVCLHVYICVCMCLCVLRNHSCQTRWMLRGPTPRCWKWWRHLSLNWMPSTGPWLSVFHMRNQFVRAFVRRLKC